MSEKKYTMFKISNFMPLSLLVCISWSFEIFNMLDSDYISDYHLGFVTSQTE